MKVFWAKKVVSISSVQTDLSVEIEKSFPENCILLTVFHHDVYHNTFTKQSISVKAAISFNFDRSRNFVLPSVKDCTILRHKYSITAVVIETMELFSFRSFIPWNLSDQ